MSRKELSKYVFTSKYARYLRDKKRRETWHEAVTRVKEMHLGKFPELKEEIEWAFDFVYKKKVSPSQRTLQFGGKPILDNHIRGYNCCATYVDRPRVFQEIMMVLLAGCGAGFSVQKQHIEKLPNIFYGPKPEKTFVIPDSIEGWADAIGVLVSSYFEPSEDSPFPEFIGTTPIFDYSQIRPKGSLLSSSSGKAPGPDPLRISIERIRNLLDDIVSSGIKKLRPIHAHDIICHLADAVLSGGVRRSSCISLFSPDDEEMIKCKTGDWFYTNPQRARANNSVVINRKKVSREKLKSLVENIKAFGEPGISLTDTGGGEISNPCAAYGTMIHTSKGLEQIGSLVNKGKNLVVTDNKVYDAGFVNPKISGIAYREASEVKQTGSMVEVYTLETNSGHTVSVTPYHRFPTKNGPKELRELKVGDEIYLQSAEGSWGTKGTYEEGLAWGLINSDGTVAKTWRVPSERVAFIDLWDDKREIADKAIEIVEKLTGKSTKYTNCVTRNNTCTKIRCGGPELYNYYANLFGYKYLHLAKRRLPKFIFEASREFVVGFLHGMFAGDATVNITGHKKSLSLYFRLGQSNKKFLQQIQILLQNFGISSIIYLRRKAGYHDLPGGTYWTKTFYELVINTGHSRTLLEKGLVIGRHKKKLEGFLNTHPPRILPKFTTKIKRIYSIGKHDVYCLNEPITNSIVLNGLITLQCHEISLYPISTYGKSGIQFCNLSSINVKKCNSPEEFYECSKAAAILGTLQAAYTDFPYLGKITEEITRREALLGVCLSGMMDRPEIAFDPEIQRKGAEIVKATNREFAKKLGINPAARTTSVKPSGTDSLVGESAAGIHPDHSRRYFRRVQANDTENVARYFAQHNPSAVEKSVWGASSKDLSLTFCVELEEGARTKNEVSALDLLKMVKLTRENWINTGKNPELCANPELSHNVSNTIHIKDEEWDGVIDYIYENREFFGGISFLPHSGDLDYQQPPFCAVHTPREILKKYGDASLFASGLITEALGLFGDLWVACDAVLERYTQFEMTPGINRWLYNMKKFAIKYTDGDIRKLTYLMKDVYNWKRWLDLNREYQEVDYTQLKEDEDTTKLEQEVACSGGSCELI